MPDAKSSPRFDAARMVTSAFADAERRGLSVVECYRAAAAALRRHFPAAPTVYCAERAVQIVFEARYRMLWPMSDT